MLYNPSQRRLAAHLFVLALAGLTALGVLSYHSASASTDVDIVSRWSAEGNANDSVGVNNGVLQGGVTYTAGKVGQGFSFDGNSSVEVANSPTLETSAITTAAWVRSFNSPGAYRYILAKGLQNCDASSYGLYTGQNGGLSFYVYDGNTYVLSPELNPEFWDGNWHHVAGTYDGENIRLYVDGAEVGTGTPATIAINYGLSIDQKFYIGAQSELQNACGSSTNFVGDIDEVKVWSRALSGSEIQADFAGNNNEAPVANGQNITTDEDTATNVQLTATDANGDALTYSIVTAPAHGALSGIPPFLVYTPAANYNGQDSFTFKANDGKLDSSATPVTITINPVDDAPVAINDSYGVAQDTALTVTTVGVLSNDSDVDGDPLTAVAVSGPTHGTLTLSANGSFTYRPASGYTGPDSFTYRADDGTESSVATVSLTVATKIGTTSTLTLSKSPQQYSDRVTFEATVTPAVNIGQTPAQSVTFKVGTQVIGTAPMLPVGTAYKGKLTAPLLEPTPWGSSPTGQMKPTPLGRTVTAVFNDVNPLYTVANATRTLMISKEDARATYTGQTFVSTACQTCTTTNVTLSATIKDISATLEANGDTDPGDIRNATVTFVNRDTGASISPLLNVTLPNANDPQTGTVTYNWQVNLGTADTQTFRVGILVDPNYYVRYSATDDALVTVAKPIAPGFISGGGYLVLSNSAGLRPGEVGTANNFSFGVRYKGNGSSPTGSFNTLVLSRVSGIVHVYQVKGSTITSLVVNGNKATVKGTASIYDVTNGSTLVASSATFEISITDNGEPGSSDTIAITIRDSTNAVWFSSNWNGVKTVEQMLGAGNIWVY